MKDAMGIIIGVVLAVIALVMTTQNTFVPYKNNQTLLANSNTKLMSSLQTEIDDNTGDSTTVSGSSIKTLINSNVGNSNVKIIVGGTTWDGKTYSGSNITVSDSDSYTRTLSVSGSTTTYTFTKS